MDILLQWLCLLQFLDQSQCVSQMTYCSSKSEITSPHTQLLSVDWPHTLIVTNNPNKNEVDQASTTRGDG